MGRRNRKLKKSFLTVAIAALVGMGTVFGGFVVKTEAASISGLKGEQNKLQDKRSNVKSDLSKAQGKIGEIQGQQANVRDEMKRIDFSISDTNDKISEKSAKVADTKVKIAKLQEDVKVIQERISKRNELLKERVRNYQETGGMVNYLEVLMGSTSFSDFVDRANAVATIMQADEDIIKQHEADKKELEVTQAQVEKDLASLQSMVHELVKMNSQLNAQREQKNKLLASLQQKEKSIHEEALNLAEQDQILADQESAVKKAIQLEKDRQAAAAARAAAARAAAAAAAANNVGAPAANGGGGSSVSAPPVSSGSWTRPAPGIISSGFGTRPGFRPGEFHYGVDIANHSSNVPIVAAADGVVIRANYDNSYGNYVIMTHSINGQIYTTVYAHQQKLLVSSGQVVSKGQQIGVMGSTGDSTGQHLHFEIHIGQWIKNTINAVDPTSIIPF
jgi:peptidoglycan hydrolase CwlO-like protein